MLTLRDYFAEVVHDNLDNSVCNKLFRKEIFTERFKKGRNNEDFLFFYGLAKAHPEEKVILTEKSYYNYRLREGSICYDWLGLEFAELANVRDVLFDIESWQPSLCDTIERKYATYLYKVFVALAIDKEQRNKYRNEWPWVRKAFRDVDSHKLDRSGLGIGHGDIFMLRHAPCLLSAFRQAKHKLKAMLKTQ